MNRNDKLQWIEDECDGVVLVEDGKGNVIRHVGIMRDGRDVSFEVKRTYSNGAPKEWLVWHDHEGWRKSISSRARENVRIKFHEYRKECCCRVCLDHIGRRKRILQNITFGFLGHECKKDL